MRIGIPKIDRSSTDRKLLICKVVGIVDGELYKLGCKSGILNICYARAKGKGDERAVFDFFARSIIVPKPGRNDRLSM